MVDSEHIDDVQERLVDEADATREDIEAKLTELIDEYSVPVDQAKISVVNNFNPSDASSAAASSGGSSEMAHLGNLSEDGRWITVEVKVDQKWEPNHDSVRQVGLIQDATGKTKYIEFENDESDLPILEEGKAYRIEGAVTDENEQSDYEDDYSVRIVKTSEIEQIDDVDTTRTFVEPIVDVNSGTGLISRCGKCGRRINDNDGTCYEHGNVDETEQDLAINAIMDDGVNEPKTMVFDRELTEEVTGISLDDAIEMFQDELNKQVVTDAIANVVVGHYFKIEARGSGGDRWYVTDAQKYDGPGITNEQAHEVADRFKEVANA